ncbi:hypothetical protein DA69_12400 [Brevundimonas naejangsanensis]|uniref:Uncharacterized protein n=1 Tax=Brevundimonas naejangsanensis TaxID=588932 RepID=A0A172Y8D0_9CAUL|nr:hypothetical protein DA69_12400 [Brevundimonas naejangsanensis]
MSTGLAEGRAGSYRREDHGFGQSGRGYLSRLRGTDGLLAWADEQGLTDDDVALNDRFELIRLKGPAKTRRDRKPLLHYDDTPDTTAMRDRLRSWAAMMAGHEVTLGAHRSVASAPTKKRPPFSPTSPAGAERPWLEGGGMVPFALDAEGYARVTSGSPRAILEVVRRPGRNEP